MSATAELTRLDAAIERGTRRLLELQRPDGIWVGELESNVTMTAQHLFWNHYLGLRTPELDRGIANELLARMRDDGTWSIWFEGPPDLSTSVEAYVACRMAGVDPGPKARAYIVGEGGIPKTRIFTKCFLALLGQWPWQRMVPIPPELVLFPPSAPFSIYNFACWARQTVVPLSVVWALRPVRHADVDLRELPQTSVLYREPDAWRQIKGDPAIRSGLFAHQRAESPLDRRLDQALHVMNALLLEHGVYHGKLHFSSSRGTLWHVDDPFVYRILGIEELTDPDICLAYPRRPYHERAVVPPGDVMRVFEMFRALRFADEHVYLRAGSLNIVNGMVGLNFSCDGSHYMRFDEFLEKSTEFWFGALPH